MGQDVRVGPSSQPPKQIRSFSLYFISSLRAYSSEQIKNVKGERNSTRNEFAGRGNIVIAGVNESGGHVDQRNERAQLSELSRMRKWTREIGNMKLACTAARLFSHPRH
jgi:hypothetical protein